MTAGNASGLNDGAAAVVLCSAAEATARGVEPLCTVVSSAVVGCEPEIMGVAPVKAVREAVREGVREGGTVRNLCAKDQDASVLGPPYRPVPIYPSFTVLRHLFFFSF